MLRARSELLKTVRNFFDTHGFLEATTPVLSADTIVDLYLEPIAVKDDTFPTESKVMYLRTSPEFSMKRLLVAAAAETTVPADMQQTGTKWQPGPIAIYQIGPVFRKGECGNLHNVEFTMLEYYRLGDDYHTGMSFLASFFTAVTGIESVQTLSYQAVFHAAVGLSPHLATVDELRQVAVQNNLVFPDSFLPDSSQPNNDGKNNRKTDWLDFLFSELVQPQLGHDTPVIVFDFPAEQSQLAQTSTRWIEDVPVSVSERFELYWRGVELANGYNELLDAAILRQRFEETAATRRERGLPSVPTENRLLTAMTYGLPPCSGTAIGLDRLLMLWQNVGSIRQVLPFPFDIA